MGTALEGREGGEVNAEGGRGRWSKKFKRGKGQKVVLYS